MNNEEHVSLTMKEEWIGILLTFIGAFLIISYFMGRYIL